MSNYSEYPSDALEPGDAAPDFELKATPDQSVTLQAFRGRRLVIAFYPADWSPVCTDQMALYNEVLPEFRRHGAELVGISVDGAWCHELRPRLTSARGSQATAATSRRA